MQQRRVLARGRRGWGAGVLLLRVPRAAGVPGSPRRSGRGVLPRGAREFILPYAAVRAAASPDAMLLDFFQSTYEAAADRGDWDRAALDRPPEERA